MEYKWEKLQYFIRLIFQLQILILKQQLQSVEYTTAATEPTFEPRILPFLIKIQELFASCWKDRKSPRKLSYNTCLRKCNRGEAELRKTGEMIPANFPKIWNSTHYK